MSLNTIILPYNKILEVEECEPVSSPSSTSFEDHKSFPYLNSLISPLFQINKLPLELTENKNKSSPLIESTNIQEYYFGANNNDNFSIFSQKDTKINNLNINQEKKISNENNKYNFNFNYIKIPIQVINVNNHFSSRSNKNQRLYNFYDLEQNESESSSLSNFNLRKNQKVSGILGKNNIYKIYDNDNNSRNPKINRVKEDNQIDSFRDDESFDSKIKNNTEEKNHTLNKKDLPLMKPKLNEINKINISPTLNYRNSNPNPIVKNVIYLKKRISDSIKSLGKKGKNDEKTISSINKTSIKTENNREIKSKKRPLILNVNLKKKDLQSLKISQFQKIMKMDGLFYILRFLDYSDIITLFKARNKQLCVLINTALVNMYYFNVKQSLLRYNNFIELLKCSIVQSKIKDSLKIDFVINIRFINNNNNINPNKKYKINLNGKNNEFIEPLYLQFGYIYNYFQKVKNRKELITKEEYEKEIKKQKIYDYYTFDLYPEKYKKNNNSIIKEPMFISKELSLFEKDGNNNIVNIQPILPFCINDKGIINLELYTTNNGFIDPDSIKIIIRAYDLKKYIKMLADKDINNIRISECEDLCVHWKNINLYQNHKSIILGLKKLFEPFFQIINIYFGNIGVFLFKVHLKAIKSGEINDKNKLEIIIKIKEEGDYIENEIRKNNLLFERRDIFELRVGDQIFYYFSLK